jgi:hypothetical protein
LRSGTEENYPFLPVMLGLMTLGDVLPNVAFHPKVAGAHC